MKRISNLYASIISMDNLRLADKKARRGKSFYSSVQEHDKHAEEDLLQLHESLKNHTYRTSEYKTFTIYEPKERFISVLPYYPDRIVHHAIMNIMEPIWIKTFTYNTYSCIKGRGIDGCAKQVSKIIDKYKDKPLYCLKFDIKKYYPSIDHDVLKAIIRKKIKDKELLDLLDEIIDSAPGVPIGNYLSQFFANLNLCYLMHDINEKLKIDCTEYADDIVLYADNKEVLWKAFFDYIKPYIEDKLHLRVKDNWQVFPVPINRYNRHGRALDYVGYKFYKDQKLLRKRIKYNLCAAAKHTTNLNEKAKKQKLAGWLGWCKHSDSKYLMSKLKI